MFTMSLWALVCATLVITSKSRHQILVARVLNCEKLRPGLLCKDSQLLDIYIGMELAVVPIFQSEITPPKARGFIVATYQISLMVRTLLLMQKCLLTSSSPEAWW